MAKTDIPISQGFYVSESLPISAQRCVNFRPNIPQTSTVTQDNLFPTPGILEHTPRVNGVTCRGEHEMAGIAYFVIGQELFRQNRVIGLEGETFNLETLGVIEGTSRVFMADNGTQLCITAVPQGIITTGKSYIFTESPDTLTEITDGGFDGPAIAMVYSNGFFVFAAESGKKFFNSPLNDGLGVYDPLDFSTAEVDPDQIRSLISNNANGLLYVPGSITTQVFRDIGRTPSPFSPLSTAIPLGITAPHSARLFGKGFAMVGAGENQQPSVWLIVGNQETKISSKAIDLVLKKLTSDQAFSIVAWTYAEGGSFFYGMTLPNTTFVYDLDNNRWHERLSINGVELDQYRVSGMIEAYGRIMVGDLQDGRTGSIDSDSNLEYGRLIKRFVTSRPFDNNGDPIRMASIEAVCESGVGLSSDIDIELGETEDGTILTAKAGADPQITFSYSKNDGRTFEGPRSRSLGKIGDHRIVQVWRRSGNYPDTVVVKFEISTPNRAVIVKVRADVD